ncbi:PilC/PilY family type IV pilus protein [Niveibacterium sp. 24ML]|uniref:pilus assembly protein n=1 Tax=Niveibacterium sp. 24ML TaxID=2985512 RepID=UPI002270510E|nr:PilC/PilY family type IV pilus protein [Niveibacterium sp. 24ML]MCX9155069.1 PilC/PilY family type IV pilus protein [Niveibacterium sp. 24ML]
MEKQYSTAARIKRTGAGCLALVLLIAGIQNSALAASVPLADQPIQATQAAPANVLLDLSVEFPTAVSYANISAKFDPGKPYYGYFDSAKCYQYIDAAIGGVTGYFKPIGYATNSACSGSWSGNFMNWATMAAIDVFRWALTGGGRVVDLPLKFSDSTAAVTVLQRSYLGVQAGTKNFPNRVISDAETSAYTEIPGKLGGALCIQNANSNTEVKFFSDNCATNDPKVFSVNVQVCVPGLEEPNCADYASSDGKRIIKKPHGLMQDNKGKMNFGAFGYLVSNDDTSANLTIDGGVLRGQMNDLAAEITETGAFALDPEGLVDAAKGIDASGTINYLNRFGYKSGIYKRFDPVSEMYAESIKYYKNLGPTKSYISAVTPALRDGFPVFERWNDPIKYWCQKNFVLGIGDVNTHADRNLSGNATTRPKEPAGPIPSDVDGDLAGQTTNAWTAKVGALEGITGLESAKFGGNDAGNYIAGIAHYAFTQDIRADFKNKQNVETHWVDVLEFGNYRHRNQYWLAAKYGGFKDTDKDGVLDKDTEVWKNATNFWGRPAVDKPLAEYEIPYNYYPASDAGSLINGLKNAFSNIKASAGAGAGVGLSSSSFSTTASDTSVFQVTYDSERWTGDVKGFRINTIDTETGAISLTPKWSASAKLTDLASGTGWDSARKIVAVTRTDSGGRIGKPFRKSDLHSADFALLGADDARRQKVLNYLRGDRTYESTDSVTKDFRFRKSLLGDIVNSKAIYVGAPSALYSDAFNPKYSEFVTSQKSRKTVVYAGANDGMLHAFDASTDGSADGGKELFALVPNAVFQGPDKKPEESGLQALASNAYTHRYYVDASPEVRDVDFARAGGATGAALDSADWRSLLVVGLGKGGRSFVAMDVTDPASWTSESEIAKKVLWEFTAPDMGYTYGRPLITKVPKYGWVVVLTGGYNNTLAPFANDASDFRGKGVLYFVDPRNGNLLEKVTTDAGSFGSPSGLAQVTGYTQNYADYTTDQIYGGDLEGNVWRFDVSQTSKTDSFPLPDKIAIAKDSAGNVQSITTAPQVEYSASDLKRYVFFGTGRLLHSYDITTSAARSQTQTFYALRDGTKTKPYTSATLPSGGAFPTGRTRMAEVTDLLSGVTVDSSKPMGWYYDLTGVETGASGTISERVIINPQANDGVISWVGTRMNTDPCDPVGQSSIYAVKYGSAKSVLTETVTVGGVSSTLPIAFNKTADGLVGLQQIRYGATVRLLGTKSDGSPQFYGGGIAGFGTPRVVNWRIIGQ